MTQKIYDETNLEIDDLDRTILLEEIRGAQADDSTRKLSRRELSRTGRLVAGARSATPTVWGIARSFFSRKRDITGSITKGPHQTVPVSGEGDAAEEPDQLTPLDDTYTRLEPFAEGGQGVLSRALDRILKRPVAIKSLRKELQEQPAARNSFLAEARVTAQLDHPSIVPVYSLNDDDRHGLHLAMKLINGMTLTDYLDAIRSEYRTHGIRSFDERKALTTRLDLFLRITEAMSYAHSRNIMHCDLKPDNIMIGEYRETYIMDWGIATYIEQPGESESNRRTLVGTPRFVPPEALRGEKCDQRADVYALGLILFELVFLREAFTGNSTPEILDHVRQGEITPPKHLFGFPVPPDLKAIIGKAISFDLKERYQTAEELAEDLRKYLRGDEVSANPDTIPTRLIRWGTKHSKATLAMTLIALTLTALAIAAAFYQGMTQAIASRKLNLAMSLAYAKCADAAYDINTQLVHLESSLEAISSEVILRLTGSRPEQAVPTVHSFDEFNTPERRPADTVYSKAYRQWLDTEHMSYKLAPGLKPGTVQGDLLRLGDLTPRLRYFWESSDRFNDEGRPVYLPGELRQRALNQGVPLFWVYLGLTNGLHLCFPGNGSYEADYDSRTRNWYRAAMAGGGRPVWGAPYVDIGTTSMVMTCSQELRDNAGKLLGVAALDISLDNIVRFMREQGNKEDFVVSKMLLSRQGEILVDSRRNYTGADLQQQRRSDRVQLPAFPDRDLFYRLQTRKFGTEIRTENGESILYVFTQVESVGWIFVEKLRLEKFLKYCETRDLQLRAIGQELSIRQRQRQRRTDAPATP